MGIYRAGGKPQWYRIGDASTIGLADARVMTAEVMLSVAKGANPAAERRAKRTSRHVRRASGEICRGTQPQAQQVVETRRAILSKSTPRRDGAIASRIDHPYRRARRAGQIEAGDVEPSLAAISAVFSWGIERNTSLPIPCRLVERNATQSRERILSESEVPLLMDALDDVVDPITASALKADPAHRGAAGRATHMRREHIKDGEWWECRVRPQTFGRAPRTARRTACPCRRRCGR